MADGRQGRGRRPTERRSLALLLGLLALAAVALPWILTAGSDLEPEPELAGRYDVAAGNECLGPAIDLRQSGQFLSLSRPDGERTGRPRVRDGEITGTVACLDGDEARISAVASANGIEGSIGDSDLAAVRVREADAADGRQPADPSSLDGTYTLTPESQCLGSTITLEGGSAPVLSTPAGMEGQLTYRDGELSGGVTCSDGDPAGIRGIPSGDRLEIEVRQAAPEAGEQSTEQAVAERKTPFGEQAASFFLAVVTVLAAARLVGSLAVRLRQPRVMGEIVAGILLGPTLFGALLPDLQVEIFSASVLPVLGIVASLGLIFYMFIIGIELDPGAVRGRGIQVVAIAASGFVIPFLLGAGAALGLYELLAPDTDFVPFALFMGIALSITAFPVLARILEELGMLGGALGTTAMAAAALDDLLGWLLVTLAAALVVAGSAADVLPTLAWTAGFGALMWWVVRPLLRRAASRYDARSGDRAALIALVLAGILISAWATETIGIALIIGALVMGAAMPKHAALTTDVRAGSETFVTMLLLPLFFAFTGLRTDIGLLGGAELWLISALLLAIAITGKLVATTLGARLTGYGWKPAAVLGTLMNTRGLTELIILNLGLEIGVISEALFTALVLMALLTTFMAGPLLGILDQKADSGRLKPVTDPSFEVPESAGTRS